jgi:hypothetical protein
MSTERRTFMRQSLALAPAIVVASLAGAQITPQITQGDETAPARMPNGEWQQDAILKAEYEQNVKDARDLTALAKSIELDLDKIDQNVLSLGLLKKLDDVEKITRRIRGRIKR